MYISRISIENFRVLEKFSIDLQPGLNVIIGENNTGKTALIDAIRIALGPGSTGGDRIYTSRDDRTRLDDGTHGNPVKIDIYLAGLTDDDKAQMLEALNVDFTDDSKTTASIHYEWSWDDVSHRYTVRRWAGEREQTKAAISEDALQSLMWTYLGALRDASAALAPNRNSRVAKLLTALGSVRDKEKEHLELIVKKANDQLRVSRLITDAQGDIQLHLDDSLGSDNSSKIMIQTSESRFEKIISDLRLMLCTSSNGAVSTDDPGLSLDDNGLGYNNVFFIATVLAELNAAVKANLRVLLIEEPEAHLHPQLQIKLADYLADNLSSPVQDRINNPSGKAPKPPISDKPDVQILMTSHSPVIAARANLSQIRVIHRSLKTHQLKVGNPGRIIEKPSVLSQLRRQLDVTKSTLFFSKGVILVEGICEALLLPIFAEKLYKAGKIPNNLEKADVSVVPVYGVDFVTIAQLFGSGEGKIDRRVAVITDADPVKVGRNGKDLDSCDVTEMVPACDANDQPIPSARFLKLDKEFRGQPNIKLKNATVTLEYDLAAAGGVNSLIMVEAWGRAHPGQPRRLTSDTLKRFTTPKDQAIHIWQEVCLREDSSISKASFIHELAAVICDKPDKGVEAFVIPTYIEDAIKFVLSCDKT